MTEVPPVERPLLITPDLNLKEDIISAHLRASQSRARSVPKFDFYDVHTALYVIDGDRVLGEYFDLGTDRHWLIGFGPNNAKYFLNGFADPLIGFNDLIMDLDIGTVTQDSAMDVFDFFLKAAYGFQFRASLVADEMHLQSLAIEDFRLRYSIARRKTEYDKWWRRVPRTLKKRLSIPKILPDTCGFKISFFRYAIGRVLSETVLIGPKGTVTLGGSVVLYPSARRDHQERVDEKLNQSGSR